MSSLIIDGSATAVAETRGTGGSGGSEDPGASRGVDAPGEPAGSQQPGPTAEAAAARSAAGAAQAAGRWQAWRARFGLAEVCGTGAALIGFAAGYRQGWSLLAAAGLATLGECVGFYGCIGAKTAAAASRATAHLGGWQRLAAGFWHAVREQLASCAIADAADAFLIRPGCMAGAAWLLQSLPGGVWIGFLAGKAVADVAWYGLEALARRGVAWSALRIPGAATWPGGPSGS